MTTSAPTIQTIAMKVLKYFRFFRVFLFFLCYFVWFSYIIEAMNIKIVSRETIFEKQYKMFHVKHFCVGDVSSFRDYIYEKS
jgi:hypothetical protein